MFNILILTTKDAKVLDLIKLLKKKLLRVKISGIVLNSKLKIKNILCINSTKCRNENKIINFINKNKINFIISFQYRWIISSDILKLVKYNSYNFHLADIDQYKGNHTGIAPILDKRKKAAVTLHKMVAQVDAGSILYKEKFSIDADETGESLSLRLRNKGLIMLKKFLIKLDKDPYYIKEIKLKKNKNIGKFIDHSKILLKKQIKNIKDIDIKYRAFNFKKYEPAFFKIKKTKYYLINNFKKRKIT